MPWLEFTEGRDNYALHSPQLFPSHLPPVLMPKRLKDKRAKVGYVSAQPTNKTLVSSSELGGVAQICPKVKVVQK